METIVEATSSIVFEDRKFLPVKEGGIWVAEEKHECPQFPKLRSCIRTNSSWVASLARVKKCLSVKRLCRVTSSCWETMQISEAHGPVRILPKLLSPKPLEGLCVLGRKKRQKQPVQALARGSRRQPLQGRSSGRES